MKPASEISPERKAYPHHCTIRGCLRDVFDDEAKAIVHRDIDFAQLFAAGVRGDPQILVSEPHDDCHYCAQPFKRFDRCMMLIEKREPGKPVLGVVAIVCWDCAGKAMDAWSAAIRERELAATPNPPTDA